MRSRKSVMISSTARDLPMHREEVRLACERAGFAPHDMMEHLTALDADAVAASLEMVENADVYIGIIAYRYGYVPDGCDKSVTEMEYDHAVKLGKPRLIFFIHADHPVTGKDVETGSGAAKLEALRQRMGKERVAAFFKSPADLRAHVVEALSALGKQLEAEDSEAALPRVVAELHRTTVIPNPPQPYIAHPYTLLQTRDLIGRRTELNLLTDWVTNPNSKAKDATIFAIVAIGGMGKSAQAWTWFNLVAPNEIKPLAGRLWWSFYESDATFENFLNRAICYVCHEDEQHIRTLPWEVREGMLLQRLQDQSYLFVLDGLERILIAYNRMDASKLADDQYDQQTANRVAGAIGLPESAGLSFVGQHRLRQSTDPRAGALLQKLAQTKSSRILITTRLYPSELQLVTGQPRPGCAAHFLGGLSDDDALALWRGLGVSGSRDQLLPIFRSVQNHPMLVQALAGEVANHRDAPGDFDAWKKHHPAFDPASLPLVQSRTHILNFALQGLLPEHMEVLQTIVAFRMPAAYGAIKGLVVGENKTFTNEQALDTALSVLEDRGLIGWDREANRYDAHPIVRGVVWRGLKPREREAVLTALEHHFSSIPIPEWDYIDSIADLSPAIERYHSLIELNRPYDAMQLFLSQLQYATYFRLSAHRDVIAWLEALLKSCENNMDAVGDNKIPLLMTLAHSYGAIGQRSKTVELCRELLLEPLDRDASMKVDVTLGLALNDTGQLAESSIAFHRGLSEARLDLKWHEGVTLQELAINEITRGESEEALTALSRAESIFRTFQDNQSLGVSFAYLSRLFCLNDDGDLALAFADQAWALAQAPRIERDFVRAALAQGQAALSAGRLELADERLHHALTRARALELAEFELPALIAIADLELALNRAEKARTRLDEAWEGIERGPYPLQASDAYNVLTKIELALGNPAAAAEAAVKAFRASWCDGPPFAYDHGLRTSRRHLAVLGVIEPDTIPFDATKFGPWFDIPINPEDEYWVDSKNLNPWQLLN